MVTNIIQIGNSKGDNTSFRNIETVAFVLEIDCERFFGREQYCDKGTTTAGMGGSCQTCP